VYLLLREVQRRPSAVVDTVLGATPAVPTARRVGTGLLAPSDSGASPA
jgi:hypothetical protein